MDKMILSQIELSELVDQIAAEVSRRIQVQAVQVVPDNKPMTIKEAAEYLNLSVPTLYGKVSRELYFFRDDLLKYLKDKKR